MKNLFLALLLSIAFSVSGFGAVGDIQAEVDSLEFDTGYAENPVPFLITAGMYGVVYGATGHDLTLSTFTCTTAGVLPAAITDTYGNIQGSADAIYYPSGIRAGNFIAITYYDKTATTAYIVTVPCTDAGDITTSVTDQVGFSWVATTQSSLTRIGTTDYYILAFGEEAGTYQVGWLKTYQINGTTGAISLAIDSVKFAYDDAQMSKHTVIRAGSSNFYAIAGNMATQSLGVKSFSCTTAGDLSSAMIDSFDLGTAYITFGSTWSSFAHPTIANSTVFVGCSTANPDAIIRTLTINPSTGALTNVGYSSDGSRTYNGAIDIGSGYIATFRNGGGNTFFIYTYDNRTGTASQISYDQFSTGVSSYAVAPMGVIGLGHVGNTYYALTVNRSIDNDGWARTYSVTGMPGWSHKIYGVIPGKVFGTARENIHAVFGLE